MLGNLVQWLDSVGSMVFWTCLIGLVAFNAVAATAFFSRRSRELVHRWTTGVLAANLILIGTGIIVPAFTYFARTVVVALAPAAAERIAGSFEHGTRD
ncbi:MAG: hypothetical protein ABIW79_03890 [Gemmatimonas sp.]